METERILLRPWRDSDAEVLYKWASDPDVGPRAGWAPHQSVEESLEIIRTVFNDALHTWAIELKETGQPIGAMGYGPSCECDLPARDGEPLIGYWVAKPYWNKGICTEALCLMLDHIRKTTDIKSLISGHFVENPASGRVMEKCGFVPTGETRIDANQYQGENRPIRVLRLELTPNKSHNMRLELATQNDFEAIITFYDDVTERTPEMATYARWSKGKHPTVEGIRAYIDEGSMYLYRESGAIVGAMAVTMYQGEDYHDINWMQQVADDKVAVIHILAVSPDAQGKGIGSKMIREAIRLAIDNGMQAIRLDALASNTPAHRLYERLGFEYRGKQHLYAENTGWTDFYFFELKQ